MGLYADKALIEQKQHENFLQVVNEVYFGRTAGINRVFNAYCDWREKYVNSIIIGKGNINAQSDPLLKVFCREVEKEFGFYSISIILDQTDTPNMMTSVPIFGTGPSKIEVTKTGYRFKEEAKVSAIFIMNAGMVFDSKYTNEESFAIFLHEVGHNFQNSANNTLIGLNWAYELVYIYDLVLSALTGDILNAIRQVINSATIFNQFNVAASKIFNTIVVDNELVSKLYSYFSFLKGLIDTVRSQYSLVIALPTLPVKLILSGLKEIIKLLLNPLGSFVGYLGERFADGFPASYGFAIDASTGLYKMSSNRFGMVGEAIDSIPIISHIYNAITLPGFILITFGDVHPETSTRAYSILNDLKSDLKDPRLDPKLKKQLEQEIKNYEKSIDNYFKEAKRIDNPKICKIWWDEFIYYKASGGVKYKLYGGNNFRIVTNSTANDIKDGKFDIKGVLSNDIKNSRLSKTKIK